MEYRIEEVDDSVFVIEKHMESKGFFRNATGSSKVGEIKLDDNTVDERFEDFLIDEEICYMELGHSVKICLDENEIQCSETYFEIPPVFVGDKKHNIPIEERIEFLYESISTNSHHNFTPYNYLTIIYKGPDDMRYKKTLFNINRVVSLFDDTDVIMLKISDLVWMGR